MGKGNEDFAIPPIPTIELAFKYLFVVPTYSVPILLFREGQGRERGKSKY